MLGSEGWLVQRICRLFSQVVLVETWLHYTLPGPWAPVCGPMRGRLYAIGDEVVITSAVPHHTPPTAICSDSSPTAPEASEGSETTNGVLGRW